eukprot:403368862
MKELEDWAKSNNNDSYKAKILNEQLLKEGYLKKKSLPSGTMFWINPKDFEAKLSKSLEQFNQGNVRKEQKVEKKKQELQNETKLRKDSDLLLVKKTQTQNSLEQIKHQKQEILECTQQQVDEIDYRIWAIVHEAQKWTDYTYQAVQFIQQISQNEVSYNDVQKTFPFLRNIDCSVIMDREETIQEDDRELMEDNSLRSPTPFEFDQQKHQGQDQNDSNEESQSNNEDEEDQDYQDGDEDDQDYIPDQSPNDFIRQAQRFTQRSDFGIIPPLQNIHQEVISEKQVNAFQFSFGQN